MAYNGLLPADSSIIAQGPAEIRENQRALKDDRIVDAGALGGYAASAFLLKSGGTMTGALTVAQGTAETPGIVFSGDPNTGFFWPEPDNVCVTVGGIEKLRVASNYITIGAYIKNNAPSPEILIGYDTGGIYVGGGYGGTGTEPVLIGTAYRNVVIGGGVNDEVNRLQVSGSGVFTGSLAVKGTLIGCGYGSESSYNLRIGTGRSGDGSAILDFIADETYTTYGLRIIRGAGANGEAQILQRGTGGITLSTLEASGIAFVTAGTERMRITGAGRLGIGIAAPDYPVQYDTRFAVDPTGVVRWGQNISSASPANYGLLSWDTGRAIMLAGASCALDFYANATSHVMRLTTGGRALIGTTTDDGSNMLQVNGNIKAAFIINTSATPECVAGWDSSGFYYAFGFGGGGTVPVYIGGAGNNVVIGGGASDGNKLRVAGNARVTGRMLVGTGTDDETHLLQVAGAVKASSSNSAWYFIATAHAAPALRIHSDTDNHQMELYNDTVNGKVSFYDRTNDAHRLTISKTTGEIQAAGFTKLGDAATGIKMKMLSGTFNNPASNNVTVAHGLTASKIVGYHAVAFDGTNYSQPGELYAFSCYANATNFNLSSAATSLNGQTFTIMVWYKA